MTGKGFWETFYDFKDTLQPAISRLTTAILQLDGPYTVSGRIGVLRFGDTTVPLGRTSGDWSFSLAHYFRVVTDSIGKDRWEIQTFAYSYLVFHGEREVFAYHWDPDAVAARAIKTPHVHFGKDLAHPGLPGEDRNRLELLSAAHMPTGLVAFTEILRVVVRDLGVEPVRRQGESVEDARLGAEADFQEAEAELMASFDWWTRRTVRHES